MAAIIKHAKTLAIAKKRYLLLFTATKDGRPLSDLTFTVYDRKGKRQITRQGEPLKAVTNESGEIQIEAMKGGKYVLKSKAGNLKIRIQKVTDERFSLSTVKSNWQKQSDFVVENKS